MLNSLSELELFIDFAFRCAGAIREQASISHVKGVS
jgi:hypothetical protein